MASADSAALKSSLVGLGSGEIRGFEWVLLDLKFDSGFSLKMSMLYGLLLLMVFGLISGFVIGYTTRKRTSNNYHPFMISPDLTRITPEQFNISLDLTSPAPNFSTMANSIPRMLKIVFQSYNQSLFSFQTHCNANDSLNGAVDSTLVVSILLTTNATADKTPATPSISVRQ